VKVKGLERKNLSEVEVWSLNLWGGIENEHVIHHGLLSSERN
jgi:hypothetical protein